MSEILRFIAGAMSHSLDVADAAPNTKTFGTVTTSHTEGSTQTEWDARESLKGKVITWLWFGEVARQSKSERE